MHKAVQGLRSLAAGGNGVDGELGAGDKVAAGEDVALPGLIGDGVNDDGAVLVEGHSLRGDAAQIHQLAHGADDAVHFDGLELAGAHGLAAALFVGFAQLHQLQLQGGHLALLADDLHRG